MKVVGIISGTSFDAIESAAAELYLEGEALVLRPLGSDSIPYDTSLRLAITDALPPAAVSAEAICRLDTLIGQAFAAAAVRSMEEWCGGRADLVASHGQTIFHWVRGNEAFGTLQLGQPAWIAEHTGVPVVSDLRSRDIAAGGHGAPLVSLFDVLLLGHGDEPRAALNLGGISNVTITSVSKSPLAFDVGPANALIDAAVGHLTQDTESYDEDGRRAARGRVHEGLLRSLMDDPYFELEPPKSTGKERFNLPYLLAALEPFDRIDSDDLVATITALTAETVADALHRNGVREVVAAGGGTRNPTLMRMLREAAPDVRLSAVEDWGVPSEAKEAYAFAVLGFLTVHGLSGTVPSCTGAKRATVLGSITPGQDRLVLPDPAESGPTRLIVESGAREAAE